MRAFVAGATGYTGREVVRLLCERGIDTVAHVRADSPRLEEWRSIFESMGAEVDSSAWTQPAMDDALLHHRPERVFALLGTTRSRKKTAAAPDLETYLAVDYGLSSILLQAAQKVTPPPGFIYLSSYGVHVGSRSAYLQARHRLEEELRASGLPYLIARPAMVSGSDRDETRAGERVATVVGDAVLGALKVFGARRIHDRYASLDAHALAAGLVSAGLEPLGSREVDAAELRERAHRTPVAKAS